MTIYSNEFILPLVSIIFLAWLMPKKYQMLSVSIVTIFFLSYADIVSFSILLILSLSSYLLPQNYKFNTKLLLSFIVLISTIFIFCKALVLFSPEEFIIPLGLSFYSFRIIHYIFEGYKGKLPDHSFKDYFYYLFFLPTFLVGPINRFNTFKEDLDNREFIKIDLSQGFERILYGYAKIVILSGYVLNHPRLLDYLEGIKETNSFMYTYFSSIHYWLNLYFQFSGYADIAIGFSALMGFKIIENFNYPFFAKNISDFWKRWHISLSQWIKDYVYMPLVALTRKPFFAILISLIIFGLWHELSFRYVLWGFYHAIGITIWHQFQIIKQRNDLLLIISKSKIFTLFSILLTFHFVIMSFTITSFIVDMIF